MAPHPQLLDSRRSVLLVIDPQTGLLPAIAGADALLRQIDLLIRVARNLDIPVVATTQNAARLGPLTERIAAALEGRPILDKMTFSAARDPAVAAAIRATGRDQALLCGVETHVCIAQTALDLRHAGLAVQVAPDAVSSRTIEKHKLGMERLRDLGVLPVAAEAAVYEWLERAGTDSFRAALPWIKAASS